eukprot:TRINITY_DN16673_c1_g1_i1.p5 TRINITY_DN16673_c1_g1~~TRINITY_DN16673_c1_g1_i1.p5  ORF type:complete len:163 (-),score=37.69 TRINITY_DN16673_c1_g1_i1:1513-2001(-)
MGDENKEEKTDDKQQQEEEHSDIITQLQNKLNQVGYLFFGVLSGISSEAPPMPVNDEPIDIPDAPESLKQDIKDIPSQIVKISKELCELVQELPEMNETEEEQIQSILEMQQLNEKLGKELEEELEYAKQALSKQQELTLALADNELKNMRQLKSENLQRGQ